MTWELLNINPCWEPPAGETEYLTATLETNQSITVPIGWNV